MRYLVSPTKQLQGAITVAGDKSISHRAIMLASIAEGVTHIKGFLAGEDCLSTLNAFTQMGVRVERLAEDELRVHGVGKRGLVAPGEQIDLGNSGTSIRLMSGLLCGQGFGFELIGDESLMKRPMRRVCDPLMQMGANIKTAENGVPPICVHPVDELRAITYEMPVASAQVKSAILLAGLYADGRTEVIENKVTRDHTERMLRSFGYEVTAKDGCVSLIGGKTLTATNIQVPADISSAAFFIVAACIARKGEVVLTNVGINPTRTGVVLESLDEKKNKLIVNGHTKVSIHIAAGTFPPIG